jgi:hypothetical protein
MRGLDTIAESEVELDRDEMEPNEVNEADGDGDDEKEPRLEKEGDGDEKGDESEVSSEAERDDTEKWLADDDALPPPRPGDWGGEGEECESMVTIDEADGDLGMTRDDDAVASDDDDGVGDSGKQSVGSIDDEKVFLRFIIVLAVVVADLVDDERATGIELEALKGAHSQ